MLATTGLAATSLASTAAAQCAPATPADGDTVTCTGTSTGKNTYTADNLRVVVSPGATTTGNQVTTDLFELFEFAGRNNTLDIQGTAVGTIDFLAAGSNDTLDVSGFWDVGALFTNRGAFFGGGDDTLVVRDGGRVTAGRLEMGSGDDRLIVDAGGRYSGVFSPALFGAGDDLIDIAGTYFVDIDTSLGDGDDTVFVRDGGTLTSSSGLSFGAGDDQFTIAQNAIVAVGNSASFGSGNDTLELDGRFNLAGSSPDVLFESGDDILIIGPSGSLDDTFSNTNPAFNMGEGNDIATIRAGANNLNNLLFSVGDDTLNVEGVHEGLTRFQGDGTATINNAGEMLGEVRLEKTGGSVIFTNQASAIFQSNISAGAAAFITVENAGRWSGSGTFNGQTTFRNQNGGTITNGLVFGAGDDTLTLETGSTLSGDVSLSLGADTVIIEEGAIADGFIDGGGGTDNLVIRQGGLSLNDFQSFENIALDAEGQTTVFSGPLDAPSIAISMGELFVTSVLNSDAITVGEGATLAGNGAINTLNVAPQITVSGMLAPTLDPAFSPDLADSRLRIEGDLSMNAGSTLAIDVTSVDDPGTPAIAERNALYSNVFVDGAASIDGASLVLTQNSGDVLVGENSFVVLQATGGVSGAFTSVVAPLSYSVEDVRFLSGSVIVDVRTALGAGAATPLSAPAAALAGYLDDIVTDADGASVQALYIRLFEITGEAELEAALRGLSAEVYAGTDFLNVEHSLGVQRALSQATRGRAPEAGRFEAWTAGMVTNASLDGSATASGGGALAQGGLFGFGYGVSDTLSVGAFAGVSGFEQDFDDLVAQIEGESFVFGAYAQLSDGPFTVRMNLSRSTGDIETEKAIPVLNETARGETEFNATVAAVNAGYAIALGDAAFIEPFVGATYVDAQRGALAETGAGDANLDVEAQSTAYLFADVGARLETAEPIGGVARLFASGGYRYEVLGNGAETAARLAGVADAVLTPGLNVARGRAILGGGLAMDVANGVRFSVGYDGAFGDGLTRHQGTAALSASF
ncbi:MAG: autotransporter outer membrane beta-barrel domain-containing protein [Pseudomonadota bacterium]